MEFADLREKQDQLLSAMMVFDRNAMMKNVKKFTHLSIFAEIFVWIYLLLYLHNHFTNCLFLLWLLFFVVAISTLMPFNNLQIMQHWL